MGLRAVVLSTFLFVLVHPLWLAATLAGLAYAWLYVRTGKLWASVDRARRDQRCAGRLGASSRGQWQFW